MLEYDRVWSFLRFNPPAFLGVKIRRESTREPNRQVQDDEQKGIGATFLVLLNMYNQKTKEVNKRSVVKPPAALMLGGLGLAAHQTAQSWAALPHG